MVIVFCGVFVLMATCMLAVALRVLVTKKPFLFPGRWLFWLMLVMFAALLANHLNMFLRYPSERLNVLLLLTPLMLLAGLVFMWVMMSGYMVLGVSSESFREALHVVLRRLDMEFTESLSHIELPQVGVKLHVAIQSGVGMGQIKVKPARERQVLKRVVRELVNYFWATDTPVKYMSVWMYMISGIFCAAAAVTFYFYLRHLL